MLRVSALLVILLTGGAGMASEPGLYIRPFFVASTPSPTHTAVPTATAKPTATATARPCPGDVNRDGKVTVDEVIRAVRASLEGCPQ